MKYKLLLLDIDGTLRPEGCERIPRENADAVNAVQRLGVKIAIATGRGRTGVGKGLLRSVRPDYWVCAGGAQLLDGKGNELALHRLTNEEMYALVDFFEDYELPLRFTFHDANYAYIGYEEFIARDRAKNLHNHILGRGRPGSSPGGDALRCLRLPAPRACRPVPGEVRLSGTAVPLFLPRQRRLRHLPDRGGQGPRPL